MQETEMGDRTSCSPAIDGRWRLQAWAVEYLWNASLHIMGSRSFRDMAARWPTSNDMFAPPMNQIPKAVFARTGANDTGAGDPEEVQHTIPVTAAAFTVDASGAGNSVAVTEFTPLV
jgi:hypothetical protein